ncbi:MAG: hypothetical protein ACJ790_14960 [Myxococcaceae bacterium]
MRWLLLTLVLSSCAHAPPSNAESLEVDDGVRAMMVDAPASDVAGKWRWYEQSHDAVLKRFHAAPSQIDPDEKLLTTIFSKPDALLATLADFSDSAGTETKTLALKADAICGPLPPLKISLGVSRSPEPVFHARDALFFNARAPELSDAGARRARIARELVLSAVSMREPAPLSSPFADALFREGAAIFAARQLLNGATETELLGVDSGSLELLRKRQALIAREALTAFDSAQPAQRARFFDPKVKDSIVPRGAGAFLADRVYQQLAVQLSSATRPLRLSGADFQRRARAALEELASNR